MRIDVTKPLFAWECLEDSPSLATLKEFPVAIPDGQLLESLRRSRGKGRDDYPVESEEQVPKKWLVDRGLTSLAYSSALARSAIRQVYTGRQLGSRQNVRDVLSEAAQRKRQLLSSRHFLAPDSLGFDHAASERPGQSASSILARWPNQTGDRLAVLPSAAKSAPPSALRFKSRWSSP